MGGVCVIVMEGVINNNKMLMYKIWSFYSQEYAKIVATRCHIFAAKMHQIRFRRWGAYSASPDPLAGFKGPYF